MAAPELRYVLDQNLAPVGEAIALVRDDVASPGSGRLPEVPWGMADPDWIPIVARLDLIAVTRDKLNKTATGEVEALLEHGLRVVRLTGKRELTKWGSSSSSPRRARRVVGSPRAGDRSRWERSLGSEDPARRGGRRAEAHSDLASVR